MEAWPQFGSSCSIGWGTLIIAEIATVEIRPPGHLQPRTVGVKTRIPAPASRSQAARGRLLHLTFQDEARSGRSHNPRRCWTARWKHPVVMAQFVRDYINAFGALSPHDGTHDTLVLPVVRSDVLPLFLAEVAQRHPDEFIVMLCNGAGWHLASDLVLSTNMALTQLPPQIPEFNPAEQIWDEIREVWFANRVFESLHAVEDQLVEALVNLKGN